MAYLDKREHRRDWIRWAIELVRRGLWPIETIEVHGPHGADADFMWGRADVEMMERFVLA